MAKNPTERQEFFCYCLLSEKAPVQEVLSLLPEYEKSAEIWTQMNVAELKLANGTMYWEDAEEDFSAAEDQQEIQKQGIRQIYAVTCDMRDQEEAQRILDTVSGRFDGRICGEEEGL